jgi:hypothetical protein
MEEKIRLRMMSGPRELAHLACVVEHLSDFDRGLSSGVIVLGNIPKADVEGCLIELNHKRIHDRLVGILRERAAEGTLSENGLRVLRDWDRDGAVRF